MRNGSTKSRPAAWLIPLLVTLLALALPAVGEAAETGSISGTVTAKGGGQPILGVEVCAEDEALEAFECASTDASGEYELLGLPAGSYKVEFWARNLGFVTQFYKGQSTWAAATPVSVTAGVPTPGIDAEMELGGTISGIVTAAATGAPVPNVVVCVESTNGIGIGCSEETSASGIYAVRGLPAGFYKVEFWAGLTEENVLTTYYPGLVAVAAGIDTPIDGVLPPGGELEGTVRAAATGAPLAGVKVCLTGAEAAWVGACLETPPSGAYRFYAIETGSYKVVFSPEANEVEKGAYWELAPDAFPTQWWKGQPTFAAATPIGVVAGSTVSGIDGSLGPGPVAAPQPTSPQPVAAVPVKPKPKPLKCKRTFVKKKVKGRARCVRRHKPKRHRKHHSKPRTAHSK